MTEKLVLSLKATMSRYNYVNGIVVPHVVCYRERHRNDVITISGTMALLLVEFRFIAGRILRSDVSLI